MERENPPGLLVLGARASSVAPWRRRHLPETGNGRRRMRQISQNSAC